MIKVGVNYFDDSDKGKMKKKEFNLEDKDAALIMQLQYLERAIRGLSD